MEWLKSNQIKVTPPKKPKKLTGTRFAAIMGLNTWNTPFKTWCDITRTYKEPYKDTIFTVAGKVIESKQGDYLKKAYYMNNLITPTDVYGDNAYKKTAGDFFKDEPIFGGMWDFLLCDENGKPTAVLEMKTTKRSEDWKDDIPKYYSLQAALYAYLLGVDSVIMVVSFLEDKDYPIDLGDGKFDTTPTESFVPSVDNTIVRPFSIREKFPNFDMYIKKALNWWEDHVVTGISPKFDEKRDVDILKALRTNTLTPETNIEELLREADSIKVEIEKLSQPIKALEKRLDAIKNIVKQHAISQFRKGDNIVSMKGNRYQWDVAKSSNIKLNEERLKEDGLYDKYAYIEDSYRITAKLIEEE